MPAWHDAPLARLLNHASHGRLCPAAEEQPGWTLPSRLAAALADQDDEDKAEATAPPLIVDWYSSTDPSNPYNWSTARKCYVTGLVSLLTFCVYASASIIAPANVGLQEYFSVSPIHATLSLSIFLFGLGIGPLILSPLSDLPAVGRSHPHWIASLCFLLFNVGAASTDSYAALIVLRFLAGFAASPALAAGGAALGDIWQGPALPKAIAIWDTAACAAPCFAPSMAGWAAMNVSWRLPYWLAVALAGIAFIDVTVLLPETLGANVLYRRAARLRAITGDARLRAPGELRERKLVAFMASRIVGPVKLSVEPIVLYSGVLMGLEYGIFYLALEALPLIFGNIYSFNLGEQTLPFVGLGINTFVLSGPAYLLWLSFYVDRQPTPLSPEIWIIPCLASAPLVIISLLWTGWTARESISYWSPLIALSLYITPVYFIFLSVLTYLATIYPGENAASALAANVLLRSIIAGVFPLLSGPIFDNLGLGKGFTLLAGLSLALLLPLWGLYRYGAWLRAMSPRALGARVKESRVQHEEEDRDRDRGGSEEDKEKGGGGGGGGGSLARPH